MKRPPPALRVAILVAAVACLGLTMCARNRPPLPPQQPQQQVQQPQQQQPQPPPQQTAPPAQEEGNMAKQKPTYFPATKAPGGFYGK